MLYGFNVPFCWWCYFSPSFTLMTNCETEICDYQRFTYKAIRLRFIRKLRSNKYKFHFTVKQIQNWKSRQIACLLAVDNNSVLITTTPQHKSTVWLQLKNLQITFQSSAMSLAAIRAQRRIFIMKSKAYNSNHKRK